MIQHNGVITMSYGSAAMVALIGLAVLSGCATPFADGRTALRQGRYDEAVSRFEKTLAREPQRVDALVGLGIAKYKLGAFDEAVDALGRAVEQAPKHATARLYLGLAALQTGDWGAVEDNLGALSAMRAGSRLAAQLDQALRLTRGDTPLSEDVRLFVATSLENEAELEHEVSEARLAAREAEFRSRAYASPVFVTRSGRLCRC